MNRQIDERQLHRAQFLISLHPWSEEIPRLLTQRSTIQLWNKVVK